MQLTPELLLSAYAQGVFPMAHPAGRILWYDPDPRAIMPLDAFHVPRSLRQTVRKGLFEIRISTAFEQVMRACAEPAPGRETTWISEELLQAYVTLNRLGFAQSVECWREGVLLGGLYGVALRGLFAGESMFSRATDASKVALVHLIERLRARGYLLLDTQFLTEHLQRFGAIEIPRAEYRQRLRAALQVDASFGV